MQVSYDPIKRQRTLEERDLDFEDAVSVWPGLHFDQVDDRKDYGEVRIISIGMIGGRMVVLVWTERNDVRHVISMRKANEPEQRRYAARLGG